jgi:hypothetical protein
MHRSGAHSRRRYKDCDNEDDAGDVEDTKEEYEDTSEDDDDADRTTGLISEEDDEPQTAGEGLDAATNQEDDAAPYYSPTRSHDRLPAALKRLHDAGTVIAMWASDKSASLWWLA